MLLLLGGIFSFFWTHSALWFFREYRDHQQNKNRPHVRTEALKGNDGKPVVYYRRWPAIWRIAHLCFAISVIMLVLTGMTLLFADTDLGVDHQSLVRRPARHRQCASLSSPPLSSQSSSGTSPTCSCASGVTGRPSAGSAPIR